MVKEFFVFSHNGKKYETVGRQSFNLEKSITNQKYYQYFLKSELGAIFSVKIRMEIGNEVDSVSVSAV